MILLQTFGSCSTDFKSIIVHRSSTRVYISWRRGSSKWAQAFFLQVRGFSTFQSRIRRGALKENLKASPYSIPAIQIHPRSLIEDSMRGKAVSHSKAAMRANLFHRLRTCLPGQLTWSTVVLSWSFLLYVLYSCTYYAFCFKHFLIAGGAIYFKVSLFWHPGPFAVNNHYSNMLEFKELLSLLSRSALLLSSLACEQSPSPLLRLSGRRFHFLPINLKQSRKNIASTVVLSGSCFFSCTWVNEVGVIIYIM